jgi:hypothetical protein
MVDGEDSGSGTGITPPPLSLGASGRSTCAPFGISEFGYASTAVLIENSSATAGIKLVFLHCVIARSIIMPPAKCVRIQFA